jgi:SAM-dependent methyltransferase
VKDLHTRPGPKTATGCPICGSTMASFVTAEAGYDIVKCRSCALVYVDPMPTTDLPRQSRQGLAGPMTATFADDKRRVSSAALAELQRRYPDHGRLLDIGCGSGVFLDEAHHAGWNAVGLDLSPAAGSNAVEVACVIGGSANSVPLLRASVQVVTMWNVLEHLHDPRGVLDQIAQVLEPGGTLVLRVPNMNFHQSLRTTGCVSRGALQILGKRMPPFLGGIAPPEHLLGFGPKTLSDLLHRTGFCEIDVRAGRDRLDPWGTNDRLLQGKAVQVLSRALSSSTRSLHRVSRGIVALSPTLEAWGRAPSAPHRRSGAGRT